MNRLPPVNPGQILTGPLFNKPMRFESVRANGPASWVVGLVGIHSERFRRVTSSSADLERKFLVTLTGYGAEVVAFSAGVKQQLEPMIGSSRRAVVAALPFSASPTPSPRSLPPGSEEKRLIDAMRLAVPR